jgi:hypothetical protein
MQFCTHRTFSCCISFYCSVQLFSKSGKGQDSHNGDNLTCFILGTSFVVFPPPRPCQIAFSAILARLPPKCHFVVGLVGPYTILTQHAAPLYLRSWAVQEEVPKTAALAVDPETVHKRHWDYSKHILEYTAAAPVHQMRLLTDVHTLTRPPPTPEDADPDTSPPPSPPVTFRILDEHLPTLYVPSAAIEDRPVSPFGFPAFGAYYAAASVSPASGHYTTVVAADSLAPHGTGAPVAPIDREFIWDIACAVAVRLDSFPAARVAIRTRPSGSDAASALEALGIHLKVLRNPPPPENATIPLSDDTALGSTAADADNEGAEADADGTQEGADSNKVEAEALEEEGLDAELEEGTVDHAKMAGKLAKKVLLAAIQSHCRELCSRVCSRRCP